MKIYAKTLVKVDRNGSKHYDGIIDCDRCGGRGWYAIGVHNGQLVPSHVDNAVCYKCHGAGKVGDFTNSLKLLNTIDFPTELVSNFNPEEFIKAVKTKRN